MLIAASLFLLLAQADQSYRPPSYFVPVTLTLLLAGTVGWLVAAVIGFARARAFGSSTRWFALASVCLLIYHLQFLVLALGLIQNDSDLVLSVGAFFNLFVALGALCAIIGFVRLTDPRL